MFLKELSKREKELFLELAVAMSKVDGDAKLSEQEMLDAYTSEMQIEKVNINEFNEVSVDKCLSELAAIASPRSKRSILLEINGLIYADNVRTKEEAELEDKIIKNFSVSQEEYKEAIRLLNEYMQMAYSLYSYVEKGGVA